MEKMWVVGASVVAVAFVLGWVFCWYLPRAEKRAKRIARALAECAWIVREVKFSGTRGNIALTVSSPATVPGGCRKIRLLVRAHHPTAQILRAVYPGERITFELCQTPHARTPREDPAAYILLRKGSLAVRSS